MIEDFCGNVFERWSGMDGAWQVKERAELGDVETKAIYRSPEEPSHVAWVGIWKNKAGDIYLRFPQITGNAALEPSYAPWYGRQRFPIPGASDWLGFTEKAHVLVGSEDAISSTRLDFVTLVSHDQGNTWEKVSQAPGQFCEDEAGSGYNKRLVLASSGKLVGSGMSTILCRDGRIVETLGGRECETQWDKRGKFVVGIRESKDDGETWGPVQFLFGRYEDGREAKEATEENVLLELEDGRLLVIIRADELQHPLVTWLKRSDQGEYRIEGSVLITDLPHAGMPSVVQTADGVIWYWGEKHYYSLNQGRTWETLPASQTIVSYYGKMMSLGGNRILCVSQRNIGDSPYPNTNDAYIEQVKFTSVRFGILKQADPQAKKTIFRMKQGIFKDLHLRVDIGVNRAEGLSFRISPDTRSYCIAAVILPENPDYDRWKPKTVQDAALSYYFPGIADEHVRERIEKGIIKINPQPLFVLAKVEGDRLEVLRGVVVGEARAGSWVQLQVKVQGDSIQAAYSNGSSPATYLGVRDSGVTEGGIGLFAADGSLGEFKNFTVWDTPQMIRDSWSK